MHAKPAGRPKKTDRIRYIISVDVFYRHDFGLLAVQCTDCRGCKTDFEGLAFSHAGPVVWTTE